MKHVYLALLLAMTAVVFLFKFQNLDTVTVQFLSASLTLPLSLLLLAVYVLDGRHAPVHGSQLGARRHLETSLEQLSHGDCGNDFSSVRGGSWPWLPAPSSSCAVRRSRHCAWVCRRWWWVSRWWLLAPVHRRWP